LVEKGREMDEKKEFIYIIWAPRKDFMKTITEEEERIMGEHFEYLKGLFEKEKLVLAGPCLDKAFGIVIFTAESEEEARKIMEDDPSVKAGVMKSELHSFRVSLLRHS
jgi:uncharacterized protein YciI